MQPPTENLPTIAPESPLGAHLIEHARRIKDEPREHAFVFDARGRLLRTLAGEKTRIRFAHHDIFGLGETIFMHNHPRGCSFSLADLQAACIFNMRAMIAVTGNRMFCIEPPGGDPFFTRTHLRDITRCYVIRYRMIPLSKRLRVCDRIWDQVSCDLDMAYRKYRLDE
jgi:hypothetical protein